MSFWSDPVASVSNSLSDLGSSVGNFVQNPLGTLSSDISHWGQVASSPDFQQNALAAGALFFGAPYLGGASSLGDFGASTDWWTQMMGGTGGAAGGMSSMGSADAAAMYGDAGYGAGAAAGSAVPADVQAAYAADMGGAAGAAPWYQQAIQSLGNMGWKNMAKIGAGSMMALGGLGNYQLGQQQLAQQRQYQDQLNALMANPNSIYATPGYAAGQQAIQRSMAAQGYQGSGNMASALAGNAGQFYQQQFNNLASLANQPVSSPYSGLSSMGMGGLMALGGF